MNKNLFAVVSCLLVFTAGATRAAENLLREADFRSAGGPESAWQLVVEKGGQTAPAQAADGQAAARQVKAATLTQTATLPEGLYELTVDARGSGELILAVTGAGERTQMLGKEWGTYGYLFHADAGPRRVSIRVALEGTVTAAAIRPASAAQQAAWAAEQKSVQQFGFVTVSAQRPTPGAAAPAFSGNVKPLAAMTRFAVLDEPRLNRAWAQNVERLVDWLGHNGFEKLDGLKLPAWMAERIQRGDAYGSVVVLSRGVSPVGLLEGPVGKPLWLEYLRAGGRIVHIGDLPLSYHESPTSMVLAADFGAQGVGLLGFAFGWNSPYWGQGNLPVHPTRAAQDWGLEMADPPITGVAADNVSLAFHVYTVPAIGKQGATDWFRNVRPDMPWSGLIKMQQYFNADNDAALRDIWRAAHYVGQPVTIPPLPPKATPAAPKLALTLVAGGMTNRHEFVRGETVSVAVTVNPGLKASTVRWELSGGATPAGVVRRSPDPAPGRTEGLPAVGQGGDLAVKAHGAVGRPAPNEALLTRTGRPSLAQGMASGIQNEQAFTLDTSPYAYGEYQLVVRALIGSNVVATVTEPIGIRYIPPESFNWALRTDAGSNPRRADLWFAEIGDRGLEVHCGTDRANVDTAIRHSLGFSLFAMPDFNLGKPVSFEKNPEYYRIDNHGQPMGNPYTAGRPSLGISHPEIRSNAFLSIERAVAAVAGIPAFRPYVLCNDDYSIYYGWDYAPHVLARYRAETGAEAPREMVKPKRFGAIPDNDPWVRWFEWTLLNVDGAYNKAETAGAVQARADVRIGPIPGGMMIPLVSMWEPAQYPPYNFGRNGFNLIGSYYYNAYWQPVLTDTFWMEIGRMGNRELPEWNMPDLMFTGGYTRNNFYHYLAGGVNGLAYFCSVNLGPWTELKRLAPIVRRIGPVQVRLAPARRAIGLLNSFTSNCFDPGHTLIQVYAYHNLMQAHFSVEPVSEDEIVAGRADQYQAIVLYDIQYLRQSVYDALVKHAASGGLVILDTSVPFDIPGAKRLSVDLGMGTEHTLPFPPEGAHVSTPGRKDYGRPDRIEPIKKALSASVQPQFESGDVRLVATPFTAAGVPYTWFVNAQNQEEYAFCWERLVNYPKPRTAQSTQEVVDWENAEIAKGPYQSTVVMAALPGVPYDLVHGRKLVVKRTRDHRYAVTVSMDRFGGALVAWLPTPITGLRLDVPRRVKPLQTVHATAVLKGGGGVLPVEFTLQDPHGQKSVVSGVRATKNGVAVFDWTPAVNDLAGSWTLQATELASGKTARTRIKLNP